MKGVDSTLLIDLLRGRENAIEFVRSNEELVTTQINIYEVTRGLFLRKITLSKINQALALFHNIRVLALTDTASMRSAEISAELTKNGEIISDADCLTAGILLNNNISEIITQNVKHFKRIKSITVSSY